MSGETNTTTCPECLGSGLKEVQRAEIYKVDCVFCEGIGTLIEDNQRIYCKECDGKGGEWLTKYTAKLVMCPCIDQATAATNLG